MHNPYAAPFASPASKGPPSDQKIATRTKRLGAAIVDAIVMFVVGTALSRGYCAIASVGPTLLSAQLGMLAASVLQWILIAQRGQTVGKFLLKIRISRRDGATAQPLNGVVFRAGPIFALQCVVIFVPALKSLAHLAMLIDLVFIFGRGNQCLHDRIADTYVIDV